MLHIFGKIACHREDLTESTDKFSSNVLRSCDYSETNILFEVSHSQRFSGYTTTVDTILCQMYLS